MSVMRLKFDGILDSTYAEQQGLLDRTEYMPAQAFYTERGYHYTKITVVRACVCVCPSGRSPEASRPQNWSLTLHLVAHRHGQQRH